MSELHLTTLYLNPRSNTVRGEMADVCRMHARIIDATVGMAAGPKVLWAQPRRGVLVIRAPEPVTAARLPADYATRIGHRSWTPPSRGRHRAVLVWNPAKSHTIREGERRRVVRIPILDRTQQLDRLSSVLSPMVDRLQLWVDREFVARGWHRERHRVSHRFITVRLEGIVTDVDQLAALAWAGIGRGRAYGGGLSIWEKA